jgi:hypothetical protein
LKLEAYQRELGMTAAARGTRSYKPCRVELVGVCPQERFEVSPNGTGCGLRLHVRPEYSAPPRALCANQQRHGADGATQSHAGHWDITTLDCVGEVSSGHASIRLQTWSHSSPFCGQGVGAGVAEAMHESSALFRGWDRGRVFSDRDPLFGRRLT